MDRGGSVGTAFQIDAAETVIEHNLLRASAFAKAS